MKRQVAVYLRLSREDVDKRTDLIKDDSNSIVSQRLLINSYLDRDPELCRLPRLEFRDDGFSGTNFDRPDFTRMMELAKRGEIGCIVVKDLSRFGRDYLEVGDYLEHIFPFLGIRFMSVNDRYDSQEHAGTTMGMDVAFRNLIYDYYCKDLSKKVRSSLSLKQREGRYVTCVPYGYRVLSGRKHQLVIDPETAPVVRRVFTEVIAGRSCTAIARELNAEGVPTPAMSKGRVSPGTPQWTHRSVLALIGNIKYTGAMVNHTRESRFIRDRNQRRVPMEDWYIRENAHQAIVSRQEYDAAQSAVRRPRSSGRGSHDRSDRVYYCGHCGGKLEKANGTVFACPSHRYHDSSPCRDVHWRKDALEDVIFEALKKQIQVTRLQAAHQRATAKRAGTDLRLRLSQARAQCAAIDREKLELYETYRGGGLTAEGYLLAKDALTEKQAALRERLAEYEAELEHSQSEEKTASLRQDSAGRLASLTGEELRAHLYDAVEKVLVYDSATVEIIWKFAPPDHL